MAQQDPVTQYFDALDFDADGIAALHADSWRRHYRGAYLDSYLDGDVVADRREVWKRRLAQPKTGHFTVVVRHGDEVVGSPTPSLDEDPLWGSLLENLHVRSDLKRSGKAHACCQRQPGDSFDVGAKGRFISGRSIRTPPHKPSTRHVVVSESKRNYGGRFRVVVER